MELLKTNGEKFPSGPEDIQAFPQSFIQPGQVAGTGRLVVIPGMTLRDYLAAKSLPSLISRYYSSSAQYDHNAELKFVAAAAYEMADAMLAERIKPVKP